MFLGEKVHVEEPVVSVPYMKESAMEVPAVGEQVRDVEVVVDEAPVEVD